MVKKKRLISLLLAAGILFAGGCTMTENENSKTESENSAVYVPEMSEEISVTMSEEIPAESSAESSAESAEEASLPEESIVSEETEPDYPYIYTDKDTYTLKEKITVYYKNTDKLDWVGIYPEFVEPGSMNSLVWQYSVGNGTLTFNAGALKEGGCYDIYLCDNDGYDVLDRVSIIILSEDKTDYGVSDAVYHSEKNNGVGKAYVEITPSSEKELTYIVSWSSGNKAVSSYAPIAQTKHKGGEKFVISFNDCLFMPEDADGIEIKVKEGESAPLYVSADGTLKLTDSKLLYRFSVLTDLHITSDRAAHISHLKTALREINALAPESIAIFTVGDNTDKGTVENYELLFKTIDEGMEDSEIPIYFTVGNHDLVFNGTYTSQVEMFKKYTGMPGVHYSVELEGTKFIVLGSDEQVGEGVMHTSQLDWLENELASVGKEKPVYLFMHQPLVETVSGSFYSKDPDVQYWYGFSGANTRLRKILGEYPNAILFTGHTHWTFESEGPVSYGNGSDASFVNCGAVGYLWTDDNDSTGGSEGYYIEVYEDYILLRGREFVSEKWCAAAQFAFPIK